MQSKWQILQRAHLYPPKSVSLMYLTFCDLFLKLIAFSNLFRGFNNYEKSQKHLLVKKLDFLSSLFLIFCVWYEADSFQFGFWYETDLFRNNEKEKWNFFRKRLLLRRYFWLDTYWLMKNAGLAKVRWGSLCKTFLRSLKTTIPFA